MGRLFSALPVRHGDAADQIEVYLIALEDVSNHALDTVVKQAISGKHPKLSKKFAPNTAELGEAIHEVMTSVDLMVEAAAAKLRIGDQRPVAVQRPVYGERIAVLRQRMASEGRKIVFTAISHDDYLRKRRLLPPGGEYHAILGEAYGPPGWVPPVEAVGVLDEEQNYPATSPDDSMEPLEVAW